VSSSHGGPNDRQRCRPSISDVSEASSASGEGGAVMRARGIAAWQATGCQEAGSDHLARSALLVHLGEANPLAQLLDG